jgi:hypothetical protein
VRNTSGLKRGGSPGRPKGVPNRATVDAREFCSSIVDDPAYQARLRRRALAGDLPPAIEAMIWYYAKGKPKDRLEVSDSPDIVARLRAARHRAATWSLQVTKVDKPE